MNKIFDFWGIICYIECGDAIDFVNNVILPFGAFFYKNVFTKKTNRDNILNVEKHRKEFLNEKTVTNSTEVESTEEFI